MDGGRWTCKYKKTFDSEGITQSYTTGGVRSSSRKVEMKALF